MCGGSFELRHLGQLTTNLQISLGHDKVSRFHVSVCEEASQHRDDPVRGFILARRPLRPKSVGLDIRSTLTSCDFAWACDVVHDFRTLGRCNNAFLGYLTGIRLLSQKLTNIRLLPYSSLSTEKRALDFPGVAGLTKLDCQQLDAGLSFRIIYPRTTVG